MGVSIELGFDEDSARRISVLWQELETLAGSNLPITQLGVCPHISLTSFPDAAPPDLRSIVDDLATRTPRFAVDLCSVSSFATDEGVVYLAPSPSSHLTECHRALHSLMAAHGVSGNPLYTPALWVPHCTVAIQVPPERRAGVIEAAASSSALGPTEVAWLRSVDYQAGHMLYEVSLA